MFFRHSRQIPLRRMILFGGDVLCIAFALLLATVIRLKPTDVWVTGYLTDNLVSLAGILVIFLIVFYAVGMYEREALNRKVHATTLPLIAVVVGLALNILVFYARFKIDIGRGIFLLAGLFIFTSTCLLRHFYRIAVGYGFLNRNALIVGETDVTGQVVELLGRTEDSGIKVFGIVSSARSRTGEFLHGIPVLGHLSNLRRFTEVYEIETILVATTLTREPALLGALRPLRYAGIEILDYVSLCEELGQEIPLDHIDDEWLMSAAMNSSVLHIRKVKRMLDIVGSAIGLVLTSPISLLAALIIRLDSPGPALYRQRRAQVEGRPYNVLKFRTMKQNAEAESGAVWAGRSDSRVTRVGRFLRKWRIDEIPQLINVLRGEMSLVGPRPERPEFIETLATEIPFYKERLLVPPGITGWAQVKFPYAASIDAARRKLQYDLYYIKHMGILLDCQILLLTFRTILRGIRHSDDEGASSTGASDGELISATELKLLTSDAPPPSKKDTA